MIQEANNRAYGYVFVVISAITLFVTFITVCDFWVETFAHELSHVPWFTSLLIINIAIGYLTKPEKRLGLYPLSWLLLLFCGISYTFIRFFLHASSEPWYVPVVLFIITGWLFGQLLSTARTYLGNTHFHYALVVGCGCIIALASIRTIPPLDSLSFGRYLFATCAIGFSILFSIFLAFHLQDSKTVISALISLVLTLICWSYPYIQIFRSHPARVDNPDTTIVYQKRSEEGKLVLVERQGFDPRFPNVRQHILYSGRTMLFDSRTEQSAHNCLTNVPLELARFNRQRNLKALVLGGGHGLITRNLVLSPNVDSVVLVHPNSTLLDLAKTSTDLRMYNLDSLIHPKVTIVERPILSFIRRPPHDAGPFDLVILAPRLRPDLQSVRLYSAEFLSQVFSLVKRDGTVAIFPNSQVDTPFEIPALSACIKDTLEKLGKKSYVYQDTKTQQTYLLVSRDLNNKSDTFFRKNNMLASSKRPQTCQYDKQWREPTVQMHSLNHSSITTYIPSFESVHLPGELPSQWTAFLPD